VLISDESIDLFVGYSEKSRERRKKGREGNRQGSFGEDGIYDDFWTM
jgi:hypothetical protein